MAKERYGIIEVETGLMDGWYTRREDAEEQCAFYATERPEYTHLPVLEPRSFASKRPPKFFRGRDLGRAVLKTIRERGSLSDQNG